MVYLERVWDRPCAPGPRGVFALHWRALHPLSAMFRRRAANAAGGYCRTLSLIRIETYPARLVSSEGEMCQGTQHPLSRGQDPQRRAGSPAHLALARPRGRGLRDLDPEKIKPGQSVETLIGYFERNRDYIPGYALRKQLGLRNSSHRGEKANDLCVAGRQKHQGMSWSKTGSVALASVVTLSRNQQLIRWSQTHRLEFQWAA